MMSKKPEDSKEKSMAKVIRFINNYSSDWAQKAFADDKHLANHIQSKWDGYAISKDSSYEAIVKIMTSLDTENENKLMKYIDETFEKGGKAGLSDLTHEVYEDAMKNVSPRNRLTFKQWREDRSKKRLEYLRKELRAERISYGELVELQSLKEYIDPSDVELLEAAGVPEFPDDDTKAKGGEVSPFDKKWWGIYNSIPNEHRKVFNKAFQKDMEKNIFTAQNNHAGYLAVEKEFGKKSADKMRDANKALKELEKNQQSSGGSMATGGGVGRKSYSDYEGKTPEQIWNEWTVEQREHFIEDSGLGLFSWGSYAKEKWSELPYSRIQKPLEKHIKRGQYAKGGNATGGEADKYKIVGGTSYHKETPDEVVRVLETARNTRDRIKIYYGDVKTGRDWHEEHDTVGTIGRSTGEIKIPLLIKTKSSYGGDSVLDDCIVKIKDTKTGRVLYQNPKYVAPKIEIVPSDMEGYSHNTMIDGELYGRHKTLRSAELLKAKMMEKGGEAGVDINKGIDDAIHYLDSFEQFWKKPSYADRKAKDMMKQLEKLKSETNLHLQKSGLEDVANRIGQLYQDEKMPEDSLGSLAGALDSLNEVIDEAYGKGGSVKKSSGGSDIDWLITG